MKLRSLLWPTLFLLVLLGIALWWFSAMERRPEWVRRAQPAETRADPLLLARRFLESQGRSVSAIPDLTNRLDQLKNADVIILPWRSSGQSGEQHERLMAWVRQGGVLITATGRAEYEDGDYVDPRPHDPLLRELDLQLYSGSDDEDEDQEEDEKSDAGDSAGKAEEGQPLRVPNAASVELPDSEYPLHFRHRGQWRLAIGEVEPDWEDDRGPYLAGFREGDGWIVVASSPELLFANDNLPQLDHAELLLQLAHLNTPQPRVWLVRTQSILPWHALLWQHFHWLLLTLAVLLILGLWRAGSRFGPLLPASAAPRRAILEHIDASARWLWQRDQGREHLLGAARQALRLRIAQRLPELARKPDAELLGILAQRYDISITALQAAMQAPCPRNPLQFTSRITLLHTLRNRL
ncbi:DUF4350 domain-containing protein [Chitinilyticum litopenaei]|uniref:DUF4350 domain-containing protein n=1 Tax=Chitinilyticum litopenaei TaxID=1121276 RepID=UPI00040682AC|nr:DUF4350 domain-containing protein [Chitinilyticum litopenaei]